MAGHGNGTHEHDDIAAADTREALDGYTG